MVSGYVGYWRYITAVAAATALAFPHETSVSEFSFTMGFLNLYGIPNEFDSFTIFGFPCFFTLGSRMCFARLSIPDGNRRRLCFVKD